MTQDNFGLDSGDPYSARVVSYAKEWAELLEAKLAEGQKLVEVAEATSRTADTDGTGYMYGAAVWPTSGCTVMSCASGTTIGKPGHPQRGDLAVAGKVA